MYRRLYPDLIGTLPPHRDEIFPVNDHRTANLLMYVYKTRTLSSIMRILLPNVPLIASSFCNLLLAS